MGVKRKFIIVYEAPGVPHQAAEQLSGKKMLRDAKRAELDNRERWGQGKEKCRVYEFVSDTELKLYEEF